MAIKNYHIITTEHAKQKTKVKPIKRRNEEYG